MKKFLVAFTTLFACCYALFAGDAAAFVDLGFSSSNDVYVFGQYGKTDKDFHAYAEIYTVDVAKNDFVPKGVFRVTDTTGKSGAELFNELKTKRAASFLSSYQLTTIPPESLLYVASSTKPSGNEIMFKDYENSTKDKTIFYDVRLMPLYEGKGSNTMSSFYIVMEKKDTEGNILSRNVIGNPEIKRKGVTSYAIDKIFTTPDGKGIVFLVEKTVTDSTGISIRYMVETAEL
ncbi:MAG: DUF2259 domain-containing protein [Spirochaetaceae bacterium]|nr:DUF2259 domain-containing protein [Spirochaetaceae bacterium]